MVVLVLLVNFKRVFRIHALRDILALAINVVQQRFERLVYVNFRDGGGLYTLHILVLLAKLHGLLVLDHALGGVLLN